ncbi:ABC transporter substrate-binding protein [Ruania suaedae]|uniref:ABC transporter substrate-binding protein n=1 Tax=Ruania suaedae TaxID=2897774 RepID=UPI001E2D36D8|nr:ABC transporter substrate-binding protein [Ruania suaedae]UFU03233.1 ABC transporter substrate-binding protein [Ruania suaedae]
MLQGSLALGGAGLLAALSGCQSGGGSSNGSAATTLKSLLPGDVPQRWTEVLAAVNTKLEADTGLRLDPEFISWTNYAEQEMLKFTTQEPFDSALEATWLNLAQLLSDGALADMTELWESGRFENLNATIDERMVEYAKYQGSLYTIPLVANFTSPPGFVVRQDLADKYGIGEITDYEALEKFLYDVKQKDPDLIPFGLDAGYVNNTVVPNPVALFNAQSWDNPTKCVQLLGTHFDGSDLTPVPFWDQPDILESLDRMRQYYLDGILNEDALTLDMSAVRSLFAQGRYASTTAGADGLTSPTFGPVADNVEGAAIAQVFPFTAGLDAVIPATFQAANNMVVPAYAETLEQVFEMMDWLSVQENHDLLSYGIEGEDWEATGEHSYEQISGYAFPAFAMSWRTPLERGLAGAVESDSAWVEWTRDFENFTADHLAGFYFDSSTVASEQAQVGAVFDEYVLPLYAGVKDVQSGLDEARSAMEDAGYETVVEEYRRQAGEYLAGS